MKYSEYRAMAKTGDQILCIGEGKLSDQIIASAKRNKKKPVVIDGDKVYYSHIGILVWWYDELMLLEANVDGFVPKRFSRAYKSYKGRVDIYRPAYGSHNDKDIFLPSTERMAQNLIKLEGMKYDYGDLFKQLLNEIKVLASKHKEDSQLFCSEAVNFAANYYWGGEDKWVTPHDIAYAEWKRDHYITTLTGIK